jgi:hypothetical protein
MLSAIMSSSYNQIQSALGRHSLDELGDLFPLARVLYREHEVSILRPAQQRYLVEDGVDQRRIVSLETKPKAGTQKRDRALIP